MIYRHSVELFFGYYHIAMLFLYIVPLFFLSDPPTRFLSHFLPFFSPLHPGGLSAGQLAQAAAMVVVPQTRNYFKSVSENKEITKIISLLSTAINSTKKEVTTGQI